MTYLPASSHGESAARLVQLVIYIGQLVARHNAVTIQGAPRNNAVTLICEISVKFMQSVIQLHEKQTVALHHDYKMHNNFTWKSV